MRGMRWPTRHPAAIAVLVSAAALLIAMGAAAPPASAALFGCSWGSHYGLGSPSNFGDPDANAGYWAKSYLTVPGGGLIIRGTFPTARYMNFTVYRNTTAIPSAHIYDAEIQPSTGVNPFQPGVKGTGTYELRVLNQAAPAKPAPNTLYTGAGPFTELELVFRVYDPTDPSDPAGSPALPQITPTVSGIPLRPLGACTGSGLLVAQPRPTVFASAAEPAWTKSTVTSLYPDPDSAYLGVLLDASGGPLVVMRARLPVFPNTNAGVPPWESGQQVRYWSLCSNTLSLTLVGCVGDFQAVQDGGVGTFVVSTPANRPANATAAHGINWIPFGTGATDLFFYRQVLASPSFAQSIANAPASGSLASTMGSYLPQIAYCTEAEWAAAGASGCLGSAPSAAAR